MAALGELRRRGSHQTRKPPARRLRAPLAALALITGAIYVATRLAPGDRRAANARRRQRRAEAWAAREYGPPYAENHNATCVEVAVAYFACDAEGLEALLANHAAHLKAGAVHLIYTLVVSRASLACAKQSQEAARLRARVDVRADAVASIDAYSRVLTSPSFWERRPCAYTLVTQLDVAACPRAAGILSDFVGPFDYVGGVTDRLRRRWKHVAPYHLNGGFSLRRVAAMRRCARLYNASRNWPEDYVFVTCPEIRLAPPAVADAFALDNGNRRPGPTAPLALHKPLGMRAKGRSRFGEQAIDVCGLGKPP